MATRGAASAPLASEPHPPASKLGGAEARLAAICLLLALAVRLLAMVWARAAGFTAISDDDFARLVLAQRFAATPRFDASQSSWLPLPIWWDGLSMMFTSTQVQTVRGLYWVWSLAGVLGCYVAGRWLGNTRVQAAAGALLCAALPHAVWLSMATVPDGYTAVLSLLALASLSSTRLGVRGLGAAMACAAALSRYEAWAVAAVVAGFNWRDALRSRGRAVGLERPYVPLWLVGLLALLGPLVWLVHGAFTHGDVLFFVRRVADYRRGLGEGLSSATSALVGYPLRLVTGEPELVVLALAAVARRWREVRRFARAIVGAGAMLLMLVLGDLSDGAPTHHPERPLLLGWLLMALLAAALLAAWARSAPSRAATTTFGALAAGVVLRLLLPAHEPFVNRDVELSVGKELEPLLSRERALIFAPSYGYLAIMAGSQRPGRLLAVNCADPRQTHVKPCAEPAELHAYARAAGASWWVMKRARARSLGLDGIFGHADYVWGRVSPPALPSSIR